MSQAQPDDHAQLPPPDRAEAEPVEGQAVAKTMGEMTLAERIDAFLPEILARHAAGETITAICATRIVHGPDGADVLVRRERGTFPVRETFYSWCAQVPSVAQRFAHARALWREALADQMVAIADDGSKDYVLSERAGWVLDTEHVQRSKLRIWAREQLLARAKIGGSLADEAAGRGASKALPPAIHVVGIEPKGQYQPGSTLQGEAVQVDQGSEDDGDA